MRIRIKKGLNIPLAGEPEQAISDGKAVSTIALLGPDYNGLKPRMQVREGDRVRVGQTLFVDKQNPDAPFTAPGGGTVSAVNRGERRVLQSVVIQLDQDDEARDQEEFETWPTDQLAGIESGKVRKQLLRSGLWTAFRTRPFSKVPMADSQPDAIFITAIDTNPLAANPEVTISEGGDLFQHGLQVIAALTEQYVYVCTGFDSTIACPDGEQFRHAEFAGPHPAGLVGTHIHLLEPVSEAKTVWHIGYQDVIAIGHLFTSGRLSLERIVALGGPRVPSPRLVRTRLGANTSELLQNDIAGNTVRVVSGSILSGHRAAGWAAYLGRYHNQVNVLQEGSPREFLSWMRPGFGKYSAARAYAGHIFKRDGFRLTTSQNGSPRAMVSIGSFEKVMPLDILATPLLKALLVGDTDSARELGCLELDEEDLSLCTFVCNGKYEYGPHLRRNLTEIEVNG